MGKANGVDMVPEKYRKTRFIASCWFYLAQNLDLTYPEYVKKSGDKQCRESVFEDTKRSMELDRLWNRPEAVKRPGETALPPPPTPAPPPPKPPNPAMAVALAEGLAKAAPQPPKGPVSPERRALAEDWIRENPAASFVQFKEHHVEVDLDRAWFDAIHRRMKEQEQEEETEQMPPDTAVRKGTSPDTVRVRKYLLSLPMDKVQELTHKKYVEKTGHKVSGFNYNNTRTRILRDAGRGTKASARPKSRPAAPDRLSSMANSIQILAEIPLDKYGKIEPKVLKEIVLDLVKKIHPQGAHATVVILAEPPVMEIRL